MNQWEFKLLQISLSGQTLLILIFTNLLKLSLKQQSKRKWRVTLDNKRCLNKILITMVSKEKKALSPCLTKLGLWSYQFIICSIALICQKIRVMNYWLKDRDILNLYCWFSQNCKNGLINSFFPLIRRYNTTLGFCRIQYLFDQGLFPSNNLFFNITHLLAWTLAPREKNVELKKN